MREKTVLLIFFHLIFAIKDGDEAVACESSRFIYHNSLNNGRNVKNNICK